MGPDCSQPPFSVLRRTLQAIRDWLSRKEVLVLAEEQILAGVDVE
jgi:hypothetical protein